MGHAIRQRSPVWTLAPFDWARNANEFDLQLIASRADYGITVTTRVQERKMWRDIRVSQRQRLSHIAGLLQRKTRSNAMHYRDVYGRLDSGPG